MFKSIIAALVVAAAAFLGVACTTVDSPDSPAPTPSVADLAPIQDPAFLVGYASYQEPVLDWTFPWGPFERTVDDAPALSWDLLSSQGVSGLLLGGN